MKLFIDTANVNEIREIANWGVVDGVTTNPSLIAKEKRDFKEVVTEITGIVDGPISAEVVSLKHDEMVEEAKELAKIHKNIIIKVPMTEEGLIAVKELHAMGIKTNVTLVFTSTQALLAAKPGRLDDISTDGLNLIEEIMDIFDNYDYDTEVIAASVRHPMHVVECARLGCDIATVPYKVFKQMLHHPLTDSGIERFLKDWESVK